MAISRMQEPQQIQSGIGSLQDPRQGYFLGKLVKKATRGIKKIVKSPVGKMALLGGLGALGGSFMSGGTGVGLSRFNPRNLMALARGAGGLFGKDKLLAPLVRSPDGTFNLGRAALTGLAGTALAAPFFMGGGDEEEEDVEVMDVANIRNMARNYYQDPTGSSLSFMPQKQFVQPNFYAAAGGRAGLMNGGDASNAQAEQMLMAEFVKYKNKGGTLSFEPVSYTHLTLPTKRIV